MEPFNPPKQHPSIAKKDLAVRSDKIMDWLDSVKNRSNNDDNELISTKKRKFSSHSGGNKSLSTPRRSLKNSSTTRDNVNKSSSQKITIRNSNRKDNIKILSSPTGINKKRSSPEGTVTKVFNDIDKEERQVSKQ